MKKNAKVLAEIVENIVGEDITKQFLNVNDKKIIIYTLDKFKNNSSIDEIEVVCKEEWYVSLKTRSEENILILQENK